MGEWLVTKKYQASLSKSSKNFKVKKIPAKQAVGH